MKKRDLLFGFALLAGGYAFAATSPYTGAEAAEGSYYLYQVETGTWLQANMSKLDQWTTHAELGEVGFDVELRKLEGFEEGFQIYCNFTNNGELNGSDEDRFFLDQGDRQLTEWIFEPVAGATNQYKIKVKAREVAEDRVGRDGVAEDRYIGYNSEEDFGGLSDNPTEGTWQLVTRAERIEKMVADAKAGKPADATFLIPWNDRGRNDQRDRQWHTSIVNNYGGGDGHDGSQGYPVREAWHRMSHTSSITLEGLPTGTYSFAVQAFYRDTEIESVDLRTRYNEGTENLEATYSAGATSAKVMSIFKEAKDVQTDGYSYKFFTDPEFQIPTEEEDPDKNYIEQNKGVWVPNSMSDASIAMLNGAYINDWIQAPVTDGNLTLSISKTATGDEHHRDWLIYKRFFLRYDSETPIAEDLTPLKTTLSELIDKAKNLPAAPKFTEAIDEAENALSTATGSNALLSATQTLQDWVNIISSSADFIKAFNATLPLVKDTAESVEKFNEATDRGGFENAIKTLRFQRRLEVAGTTAEDVFAGQAPKAGEFYIYNLGQKKFLAGGSDWGAHAALALPGVEITLETEEGLPETDFHIETGLYNGENNHYLNYRGYMDAPIAGAWRFLPVEGKENVYNIVQADYPDVHVAWNPWGSVDAGNNDETNVCTEMRDLQADDLNAQWKLVTREEREALLDKASLENPADATFFIQSPNFSQRENATDIWVGVGIPNYGGGNFYDFIGELWNASEGEGVNQMVENLPAGTYILSAQGFYRNGTESNMGEFDQTVSNAVLYAGSEEVEFPNIISETGKAPYEGRTVVSEFEGTEGEVYEVPDGQRQATDYFKAGLYKMYLAFEHDGSDLAIGFEKTAAGEEGDWIVADNFRLTYYGDASLADVQKLADEMTGVETIETEAPAAVNNDKIYNLQGIEVKNATVPGIYIQNGKKFVVTK